MNGNGNLCIVTWQGSPNFGTNLQAYALQHYLEGLGYSIRILSFVPKNDHLVDMIYYFVSEWRIYWLWIRFKHFVCRSLQPFPYNPRIQRWARQNLHVLRVLWPRQLRKLIKNTDCFISGSDQLWNTFLRVDPAMYLEFAKDKKCISYATSLGTKGVNPEYVATMRNWLQKYRHIGRADEPSRLSSHRSR